MEVSAGSGNLFHVPDIMQGWLAATGMPVAQWYTTHLPTQEMRVQPLGWKDLLEEEMATHSSILFWEILWTEEPGRLQSMGSQRVGCDWAHTHTHTHTMYGTYGFWEDIQAKALPWWRKVTVSPYVCVFVCVCVCMCVCIFNSGQHLCQVTRVRDDWIMIKALHCFNH